MLTDDRLRAIGLTDDQIDLVKIVFAAEAPNAKQISTMLRSLHWHTEWWNPVGRDNGCAECDKAWPCPTISALDRIERS